MASRNITGPLRKGFDYQDAWTLKMCGEWLLNPSGFKWIQSESDPSDADEFFLDDFVMLDGNNLYHLYQAKFKADSDYEWSWEDLLKEKKGKRGIKPSLISKWSHSMESLGFARIQKATFLTNARFNDEFLLTLKEGKVDIAKLQQDQPEIFELIEKQIGSARGVKEFFGRFEFIAENKTIETVEAEICGTFYDDLRVTSAGLNNLWRELRTQTRKDHTEHITIQMLREWCEFDSPKPLNEDFEIPPDFQCFDNELNQNLVKDITEKTEGIRGFFGKPGVGKSVYLSQLAENLKSKGFVVIKHHFHLSTSDFQYHDRLSIDRVVEAVKAQLKTRENREYLGHFANKNSKEVSLREFISEISKNLLDDGKRLVLIIDGLDHIVREIDIGNLKRFMEHVFYPQPGLWIILGMQPQVRNERLLKPIFRKIDDDGWVEITGLDEEAVSGLVKRNLVNLNLPENKEVLQEFLAEIFRLSQGNPLYLRYLLSIIKTKLGEDIATKFSCSNIIQFEGSIKNYYEALWDELESGHKYILNTLISIDFNFTKPQLFECLSGFVPNDFSLTENYKKLEHLVSTKKSNKISIFHNSFKDFLHETEEWRDQQEFIKQKVKKWLEQSDYEYLKWAELQKLELDTGNDIPILSINREWLLDAITFPRSPTHVNSLLELAYRTSLKKADLGKAVLFSNLKNYYEYSREYLDENFDNINAEALSTNSDFLRELVFEDCQPKALQKIAEISEVMGDGQIQTAVRDVVISKARQQEFRKGELPTIATTYIEVLARNRDHDLGRIFDQICRFRDIDISPALFCTYSKTLLTTGQTSKLRKLLSCDFEGMELASIKNYCLVLDLKSRSKAFEDLVKKSDTRSAIEDLYLHLIGNELSTSVALPEQGIFPAKIPEYYEEGLKWQNQFVEVYISGILLHLSGKDAEVTEWISNSNDAWPVRASVALLKASEKAAESLKRGHPIRLADVGRALGDLENLTWPENRDTFQFRVSFGKALKEILVLLVSIQVCLDEDTTLIEKDIADIAGNPFISLTDLLEVVITLGSPCLGEKLLDAVIGQQVNEIRSSIGYMYERAESYKNLSVLCSIYGRAEMQQDFLHKAADNLVGYGYRKDTYLFDVLDAIENCAEGGINNNKIDDWIRRIIPLALSAQDFTDGKETNHLPSYLSSMLSSLRQPLLYKFYFYESESENFDTAEIAFKNLISGLEFGSDGEIAIGTTALDAGSHKALIEEAESKPGAQTALDRIREDLGNIDYGEEDRGYSPDFKEKEYDYNEVKPEDLSEFLPTLSSKWDRDKYLSKWLPNWIPKCDKNKLYYTLKNHFLLGKSLLDISVELLDGITPLALEFEPNYAFELLCAAQYNDHGWERYFTDRKKAEHRWKIIADKFKSRYLEFFERSAGERFSLERAAEFMLLFSDRDRAQDIAETGIHVAEGLIADLDLPQPAWAATDYRTVDEVDILLQRMLWPGPLTRERAATALARLLNESTECRSVFKRLVAWINNWDLESIVAIGLLPIVKALQCPSTNNLDFINLENICKSLKVNSPVIELLLKEINKFKGNLPSILPKVGAIESCDDSIHTSSFFNKYIAMILCPIYSKYAEEVDKHYKGRFSRDWSFNGRRLAEKNRIAEKPNNRFYGWQEYGKFLIGFSTKVSESYRSAFIRTLYKYYSNEKISRTEYTDLCYLTLPIDLNYWRVRTNRAPKWWPGLAENATGKLESIEFARSIEELPGQRIDGMQIIFAEGAIEPAKGWRNSPDSSFTMVGFAYRVLGPDIPEAEEIAECLLYRPRTSFNLPTLSRIEEQSPIDHRTEPIRVRDLVVIPIVTRNSKLQYSTWQYYRDKYNSVNVCQELRSGNTPKISNNHWSYADDKGHDKIQFVDWLEGLQERYEFEMPQPYGHYVLVDEEFLTSKLESHGFSLCYLVSTRFCSKQYSYEKVETIRDYKLIGFCPLIK